jgi:hypothetical protein
MRGLTALDQFNISRNKLTGHVFNLVVGGVTVFVYATDYLPMNKFIMSHGSKLSAGCYYAPYKTIVGFTNDNNVANPQLSTRFGIHVRKTDKQYYTIFELKTS